MSSFEINTSSLWTASRSSALQEFISRSQARSFSDGTIANLSIQEYWSADLPPQGSEQMLAYYVAKNSSFLDLEEFATIVFFLNQKTTLTIQSDLHLKNCKDYPNSILLYLFKNGIIIVPN